MVLQRFFSGYLGWLRCYITPLPYNKNVQAPLKILYEPKNHCWCCLAPFLLKKYRTIWHLLWFYIAPFDKGLYSTFKDMVLYSPRSDSPMIMSQKTLLVLYSTFFLRVYACRFNRCFLFSYYNSRLLCWRKHVN